MVEQDRLTDEGEEAAQAANLLSTAPQAAAFVVVSN
jgi:hypothetical protein